MDYSWYEELPVKIRTVGSWSTRDLKDQLFHHKDQGYCIFEALIHCLCVFVNIGQT